MCGIFGFIGEIPEMDFPIAHTLLSNIFIESKSRGKDASGFAALNYKLPDLLTEKRNVDSNIFVARSSKFRALKKNMPNIFIGHTRATTTGDPRRNRNNHPFLSQRLALVHNGRIPEWDKAAHRLGLSLRTETDSEVLLRVLDKHDRSASEGCKSILENLDKGSEYAISFFNHSGTAQKELFLFRNTQRPCWTMRIDKWEAVFFASTDDILRAAIDKTFGNRSEAAKNFQIDEPKQIDAYVCYRITHTEKGKAAIIQTRLDPPKVSSSTTTTMLHGSAGGDDDDDHVSPFCGPIGSSERSSVAFSPIGNVGGLGPSDSIIPTSGGIVIATEAESASLSSQTANQVKMLERALNETLKVVADIQKSAHMTYVEYEHFMQWMLDI